MDVWFENYAKLKVRPSSHQTYKGYINNHIKPHVGSIPLSKLTSLDLQKLYKMLLAEGRIDRIQSKNQPKGLSAKTVRNINQIISSALNLAKEQKLISSNPTEACALPKVEHREMKTLPVEQLTSFLREAKETGVYEMYYIELATGLRRGELLGLKWNDIDMNNGTIRVQRQVARIDGEIVEAPLKTKNSYRTVSIGDDAIEVLKEQREIEYVFPSPNGGPISPDSVLNMLHRVLERAGLPKIRFHDLRHTFATLALQNGVDIKTVSGMLARNERENNYITDETARKLRDAASELGRCDVSVGFADSSIERLNWFVGGDADKIRRLQNKLNELGIGQRLEEDGVFGVKTLAAWNKFKEVLTGAVPQLGFIDPLQPEHTGYSHRIVAPRNLPKGNEYSIILDKNNSPKGTRAFMLDKPHDVDGKPVGYHMNVEFDVPEKFQKFFYNHKEISESTYLKLKNFKNVAKPVRIAGRVLLAMGSALDVIELGTTIYEDVKDANNFPEKGTVSTAVEIGGRWTGSVLGAQKGAAVGAVIGSAFPVVGTAVGGAVGGVLGGIGGSYLGGWIGECVVDITWLYE